MARVLVWDLPTRLFHWALAGGFAAAAVIALGFGEDSPLFPYHAMIGVTLALMVVLRVAWGLVGSRYARFGAFIFGPGAVIEYLKGTLTGSGRRHIGHNPGSAYAIFAMLGLMLGLAATGTMLGQGNDGVKEVHELLAYAMLAVIAVHVLGVLFHTARHRENITASMVHGHKEAADGEGIRSARPVAAALLAVIVVGWAVALVRSYLPATQSITLPILGLTLTIGEMENESGEAGGERHGAANEAGERGRDMHESGDSD